MIARLDERWSQLSNRSVIAVTTLALMTPMVVALVALAQRRWYPVLDLAMTEFRIRDVGSRQTPLIGLPGRIGVLPDQGSHPGPLSFWLLAPGYRLFGGSAWAMEVATVMVSTGWIALALWIGQRRLGRAGVAVVAAVIAVLVRGFGLSVLTQPWNPFLPLLAWLVVLLATWAVVDGDDRMLIPLVVAASYAAQTHIPYLLMAGGLGLVAVAVVLGRWLLGYRSAQRNGGDLAARRPPRSVLVTTVVFGVLWLAPLADQIRRDPGNLRRLLDHFSAPSEDPIGLRAGIRLMLRHLDVVDGFVRLLSGSQRFVEVGNQPDGPIWSGVAVFVLWIASAATAWRLHHRSLMSLHAVIAITLFLTTMSTSRIFGQRWYYLTLWAWVTTTLVLVAIAWTAVVLVRARTEAERAMPSRLLVRLAVSIAALMTASMIVIAPGTDHPEEYLGETLGELLPGTTAALDPAATYVVEWKDAYFFGSQAFGLVSELRRSGFDVGGGEFWRVPMTNSRTIPDGTADEAIVFVTGSFVDDWRSDPRFREVATVDPRTPDEVAEFEMLRTELREDLIESGLDELTPLIDTNLFGLNIDQRISPRSREISARLIRLGQESAVFIGPVTTTV